MPLDQLSGIFIVSAFIRYTNTPDFSSFFFSPWGPWLTFWARCQVLCSQVFMLVLWAMLLESSPSRPHPRPGPGQRSASPPRLRSRPAILPQSQIKKGTPEKRGNVSAIQNTFFYQTGDILPTKYCQMLANSTYFSYPAPWNLGLLQHSRHIIDWLLFFFDPGSPGRNEPNIHSVFCFFPSREKCFLWYKCNITGHKSFRNSFGNHLKNTFIWEGGRGHQ